MQLTELERKEQIRVLAASESSCERPRRPGHRLLSSTFATALFGNQPLAYALEPRFEEQLCRWRGLLPADSTVRIHSPTSPET